MSPFGSDTICSSGATTSGDLWHAQIEPLLSLYSKWGWPKLNPFEQRPSLITKDDLHHFAGQLGHSSHVSTLNPQPLESTRLWKDEMVVADGAIHSFNALRHCSAQGPILVIIPQRRPVLLHWYPLPRDDSTFGPHEGSVLPNRQFVCQGLTLAFAPRSIAKSKPADGNFSFMALIRLPDLWLF